MKKFVKVIAAALAILISAGATGLYASARENDKITTENTAAETATAADAADRAASDTATAEKDETVYVIANADGSAKKIIVSDWLKNAGALDSIEDLTTLTGIENVKGNESYSESADGVTWAADGADIYYKGTSDKELPITVKITYYLDGAEIQPDDLAGKSGHVKIRYDYINNEKRTVTVGNTDTEMYVPFIAATGMVLDTGKFVNIEAINGKVMSDADKAVVLGYALPGMTDNLDLSSDLGIDIPEYFELEADVTDFELSTTVTLALPASGIDIDLDGDASSLNELSDASAQLVDGSAKLYDGISELLGKSGELTDGINALTDGADALYSGSSALSDGLTQISGGASQLSSGASELTAGITSAQTGAQSISDGLASTAAGASQLSEGLTSTEQGAEQLSAGIDSAAENLDKTIAANKQVLAGLEQVYAQTKSDDVAVMIETLKTTIAGQEQVSAGMSQLGDGADKLTQGAAQLKTGADTLGAGIDKLSSGADALGGGIDKLAAGGKTVADGAAALAEAADTAATGASSLTDGALQLKDGTTALSDGAAALIDGVRQLSDGAEELKDGMARFNRDGVQKLLDVFGGDLEGLADRLTELADGYNSYSGISGDMSGSVRFIYMSAEISCD